MGRPRKWFNDDYGRETMSFQVSGNLPAAIDAEASKLGVTKSDLVMHMIVTNLWDELPAKFQADYRANRDASLKMPANTES